MIQVTGELNIQPSQKEEQFIAKEQEVKAHLSKALNLLEGDNHES